MPVFALLTAIAVLSLPSPAIHGTCRFNLAQGTIATTFGIGASLSGLATGEIVDHFGYSATFLKSGAVALIALAVFARWMPETVNMETSGLKQI